jgi:hypothetical protein
MKITPSILIKRIRNLFDMIKRNLLFPAFMFFCLLPVNAQVEKQEPGLKREVTLYNPYKPSLPEAKKRSFLPDMRDTIKIQPDFHYDIKTEAFKPEYNISPIKAASLLSDPLPKLYKSFINIGIGNYFTPLAEISITNERSKKGTFGFYGRHYSTNGKIELQNNEKVFAGYMDNDVSLFGRKFFKKNVFESSVDFSQKTRYAYGYDTSIVDYSHENKAIRLIYNNLGARASLASLKLDSTKLGYNFDVNYDFFHSAKRLFQHSAGIKGIAAKSYNDFYIGSGLDLDFYILSDSLLSTPKYISSISPFVKKSSDQWSFKLGFQALLEKNMTGSPVFHLYPDIDFGFNVIPSYVRFFLGLTGKLEKSEPSRIIMENPFLTQDGALFKLPNTDHELIFSAGFKGNTGLEGNYIVSTSYSIISDEIFYSNISYPANIFTPTLGNYFLPVVDDVEILNVHAEMSGEINDKLSFSGLANYYNYSLAVNDYPWNKSQWDGQFGLKYNLRNKIIAGMEILGQGKRRQLVTGDPSLVFEAPAHLNMNLNVEYRYSKILSVWTKFNNISYNRYYEWAYYPSQRFLCMLGFTYSL